MNIKNGIILLVVALLVGIGSWYLFTHSQSLPKTLNEKGDRQVKEEADYYTVQAVYPNTTRLGTRTDSTANADQKAVSTMESYIEQTIATFKRDANKALTEQEKTRLKEAGLKYAISINYYPYNSGDFASFEYDISQDVGGAHPSTLYKTFVFDLKGNEVRLSDLFKENTDYLGRISAAAKKQVADQMKNMAGSASTSTIIAAGLDPKQENFANWVDNDGILMFFIPPNQAAASAAGSFIVRIPLDELEDILKPGIQ
jgi:hypothetical protein